MRKFIFIISVVMASCSSSNKELDPYESRFEFDDNSIIEGKWHQIFELDSIVFIFEKGTARKYAYDRQTTKLLERYDYGKYTLTKRFSITIIIELLKEFISQNIQKTWLFIL